MHRAQHWYAGVDVVVDADGWLAFFGAHEAYGVLDAAACERQRDGEEEGGGLRRARGEGL